MFTGLIQEIGTIKAIKYINNSMYLHIECDIILQDLKIGDSVAVNGACQTVVELSANSFKIFSSTETLKVTNFSKLNIGDKVNLERTLRLCDRLDGHIVSGHIDGTGEITTIKKNGETTILTLNIGEKLVKQTVEKGSICVEGISLTIASISGKCVDIAIIPHTMKSTNLQYKKTNDILNIETDIMAKYVEKYLSSNNNSSNITMDLLERNGFL